MKIAMTMMVRDEVDIIAPMIEHHLRQGVDVIIATDNGSVDGTTEILEKYAARGHVVLRHDPVHRKQQGVVVTQMARDAASIYGADWVLNADADEFWMPKDPALTLRDVFVNLNKGIQSFLVEVVDMTGPPALAGTGLQRLLYRDLRSTKELNAVGLHSHSTPNAVHVGDPSVTVVQGNHLVSLASLGTPPPELAIEVLHFPWRSWAQFSRKVDNSGRAYLNASGLTPSPNHHGMRDFHRLQDGTLFASYLFRHPTSEDLAEGIASGSYVEERRIADTTTSPAPDVPVDQEKSAREWAFGKVISGLEYRVRTLETELAAAGDRNAELAVGIHELEERLVEEKVARLRAQTILETTLNRRVVRAADRIVHAVHSLRHR